MTVRSFVVGLLLLSGVAAAGCASESSDPKQTPMIQSRQDLDSYLRAGKSGPLDRLSTTAKQRFIDSLVFTDLGLASFYYGDLNDELTVEEARSVLQLFGVGSTWDAVAPRSGAPLPPEGERDYYCASPGSCAPKYEWICTVNC